MTILELIESFIDPTNTFLTMMVSLGFMAFLAIGLGILGVPKMVILMSSIISLFMFVAFGWFPIWIIILLAILLFILLFNNFRGNQV